MPTPSDQPVLAPMYRLVADSSPSEDETRHGRPQSELGHVAAIDVLEPPAVLLLQGPFADLFLGQFA
jgi:hypothetical protein